jgi:hypothetical protein
MRVPDFLIIGAMKGGTTLLYDALQQHPEIFMPLAKEPHFFSVVGREPAAVPLEGARTRMGSWQDYTALFDKGTDYRVVGEASTSYLYTPWVAEEIERRLGDIKIVCILRNPVERAYSHYLWLRRLELESAEQFGHALELEAERIRTKCDFGRYVSLGMFNSQLEPYLRLFRHENVCVLFFQDILADPQMLIQRLYRFLDLERVDFQPDLSIRRNPSGEPRFRLLDRLFKQTTMLKQVLMGMLPRSMYLQLSRIRDWNLVKPSMDPGTRKALVDLYRDEIYKLETLTGRDLSEWRT